MTRLKELRQEKDLTLLELREELKDKQGITFSTSQLSSFENGKRSPRRKDAWELIADYFNVSVPYLLGYDNDFEKANQNRLKELRKEKKDTQAELANSMGVNVKTISRWEKGEFEIKPAQAKMLADYFGVSETYLLGYSDLKNEADTKVSVLDDALEKLRTINNMLSSESDEAPNMWTVGFLTAIAAIENFKKEIEFGGEQ